MLNKHIVITLQTIDIFVHKAALFLLLLIFKIFLIKNCKLIFLCLYRVLFTLLKILEYVKKFLILLSYILYKVTFFNLIILRLITLNHPNQILILYKLAYILAQIFNTIFKQTFPSQRTFTIIKSLYTKLSYFF